MSRRPDTDATGLSGRSFLRAGLVLAVGTQPVLWAAGRWGLLGRSGDALRALDQRTLEWMAAHRAPALDAFFETVTHLGSFVVTGALAIVLAAAAFRRGRRGVGWFVLGGFGGAALLTQIGKVLVARPRPASASSVVTQPTDLSFPSAHATQVMALALVLWLAARDAPAARRQAITGAAALSVVLVSLSRMYLQVHYPSDVLAGLVGATAWVLGLWLATGHRV